MSKTIRAALAAAVVTVSAGSAHAAVLYNGGTYAENFDLLPNTPEDIQLETIKPWRDDTAPGAGYTSLPGVYLWHAVDPGAEDGANGHQRFRIGTGSGNAGSFYSFGATGSTERALGSVGSTSIATNPTVPLPAVADNRVYSGIRLTNNTGGALGEFTLTYTAEQWRDGGNTTPGNDTLYFDYSLNAASLQDTAATYTNVAALSFTGPNQGTAAAAIDGNAAANRARLSATITGITWAPGTDLWLRWSDPQLAGNDAGLAADDVVFTAAAVPEPGAIGLAAVAGLGLLARRRGR